MLARFFRGGLIRVASGAHGLACEHRRMGTDPVQRFGTVVAVEAETLRHDHGPQDEEEHRSGRKDQRGPDEVAGVPPLGSRSCPRFSLRIAGLLAARGADALRRSVSTPPAPAVPSPAVRGPGR